MYTMEPLEPLVVSVWLSMRWLMNMFVVLVLRGTPKSYESSHMHVSVS